MHRDSTFFLVFAEFEPFVVDLFFKLNPGNSDRKIIS